MKSLQENLTKQEKLFQISIGVLLGDASVQKNTSKKVEKWRLQFSQSAKHSAYIHHLHDQLKAVSTPVEEYVISEPFFNQTRNMYSFQTVFDKRFKCLADIFLNCDTKKKITCFFKENLISPLSLAYGFIDDGGLLSYKKDWPRKGLVFNTQGFTFGEVETLSQNLNRSYNLKTWIKLNKKRPIIAVSGKEYHQISGIFLPYMHQSLKYKLPLICYK